MRKSIFLIAVVVMLMACGGKKAQTESSEVANNDSTAILAQKEMTGLIKLKQISL